MSTEALKLPSGSEMGAQESPRRAALEPLPHFRDPVATRLNIRLSSVVLVTLAMLALSLAGNFAQWYRGPILVVMQQTPEGAQTVAYNGHDITSSKGGQTVSVGKDRISDGDKTYIAGEYVRSLYGHNMTTMAVEVPRALRMMVPDSAQKLLACIKRSCEEFNLNLDTQRSESWQQSWTPQEVSISQQDPFTVNLIGEQKIVKVVNNQVQTDNKQLRFSVKLVVDPKGRDERNLRSGVLVALYEYKELSRPAQ